MWLTAALVLGQTSPGDIPGWAYAVGSAVGGALITILSGKIVVPTFAYQRERDRADRLEAQLTQLQDDIKTQVVPALTRATDAILVVEPPPAPRRRA